ncbi:hypothetical protein Ddye_024076, partial [Dipteronia dyeriana]
FFRFIYNREKSIGFTTVKSLKWRIAQKKESPTTLISCGTILPVSAPACKSRFEFLRYFSSISVCTLRLISI